MALSKIQKQRAIELLDEFVESGELVRRREREQPLKREEFQNQRRAVALEISGLISKFLNNQIDLDEFKTKVDGLNKRNPLWGFRGIKGQMFFNQLCNTTQDKISLSNKLKGVFSLPSSIEEAENKLNEFSSFVHDLRINFSDKRLAPRESSVLYFLTYFWQIQDPQKFPIYYSSIEQVFIELGFMSVDIEFSGDKYNFFYNLNNELKELFAEEIGRNFSYWDVEHVFWHYYVYKGEKIAKGSDGKKILAVTEENVYIPPIVKEIPPLAHGDKNIADKYQKENKQIEDVLEDKVYKLFVMLGFESEKLGKGKGREPDGIARARQENYAIIYDVKSREGDYTIGTDDRAIKEYIENHSKDLRRDGFKNIYFVIISGAFKENQEDIIKKIKIETGVQEILLLKADLLLFILELKLRDSTIDLSSLQEVFHSSGIISKEDIQEYLVGR